SGGCGTASATVSPRRRPVHRERAVKFCASSANLFAFVSRPPRTGINESTVLAVPPAFRTKSEFGNLVSKGIIDPTKVVRIALQDGASIAGLLITTEAMVAEKPKKETPMPAMPPGGGMDY
ncbi:MAG: hypothetical protein WAV38_26345, partial [Xanthobacteraceae bacterium]